MPKNITFNAFFVPLHTKEAREKMFKFAKDAEIEILSCVFAEDILNVPFDPSMHTYEWYKGVMAEAAEFGLGVQTRELIQRNCLEMSEDELHAFAEKYKGLTGFGGFYVIDEPQDPTPYARVENALRDVYPDANVNVNFLPVNCYASPEAYFELFCKYGNALTHGGSLSLDCYNFPGEGGVDETNLFNNYNCIRRAGLATGCDTAVYVQAVGMVGGFNYRRPSEADIRYNMMAALAYGVKEIKFFTFASPGTQDFTYTDAMIDINYEPTELYFSVCAINKKIHAIGEHLAACDAKEVYHTKLSTEGVYEILPADSFVKAPDADVIVSFMEERVGNGKYVMVVNKDILASQKVTLIFEDVDSISIVDDKTGELIEKALEDGALTLDMLAGDCALIKL